jgi:hypothetical protein
MLFSILAQNAAEAAGYLTCLVGGVIVVGLMLLASAIKIIPEYQRMVIFRLGRVLAIKGPGVIFLIPVIDRGRRVDLREQVRDIPHQTVITKDNAGISVDFIWYFKVLDPTLVAFCSTMCSRNENTLTICSVLVSMKSPSVGVLKLPMSKSAK